MHDCAAEAFQVQPFFEAIDRYEGIREAVFGIAQAALRQRIENDRQFVRLRDADVSIGPIDEKALANVWASSEFPWGELHALFQPYVNRFEVAIWADGRVCALAYGRPSKGSDNITLHFLERWIDSHNPLKGVAALLVTEAAELYAIALGKNFVKLKDPHSDARPTYVRLGFRPSRTIRGIDYMERRIGDDSQTSNA